MCSQTKFGILWIYACDTIFLDLMAVVKVRDAQDPRCIKTRILAFLPQIILEIYSRYDMNTQTLRTLRTGSLITICLPLWGIKPVFHDRHKTVPEFIVILCDQMWMTII